jgi:hypothetical protein
MACNRSFSTLPDMSQYFSCIHLFINSDVFFHLSDDQLHFRTLSSVPRFIDTRSDCARFCVADQDILPDSILDRLND